MAPLSLYHVEDSVDMQIRILTELRRLGGIELAGCARHASVAIAEIDKLQPDLVVLDMYLAEGTGLDVLKEIRRRGCRSVSIMLTNHADSVSRSRCLRHGARYFFDKSSQMEEFFALLRQLATPSR